MHEFISVKEKNSGDPCLLGFVIKILFNKSCYIKIIFTLKNLENYVYFMIKINLEIYKYFTNKILQNKIYMIFNLFNKIRIFIKKLLSIP